MKKIVFVCLGNICRSPMAEFIFKNALKSAGRSAEFEVSSRATSYEEEGNPVYPPARAVLAKHGVSCAGKYASRLQKSEYSSADLFVCMEDKNVRDVLRIFGSDPEKKVVKLLDYTKKGGNIADPYYTGDFDLTYAQIEEGCRGLLASI